MAPTTEKRYIYDLPYSELKACCDILDEKRLWQELSHHMGYDMSIVQEIKRELPCGKSPSEKLIALWGHLNHTVVELLILFHRMKAYDAVDILKQFVNPIILVKLNYNGRRQEDNDKTLQEKRRDTMKMLNRPIKLDGIITTENNQTVDPGYRSKVPELAHHLEVSKLIPNGVKPGVDMRLPLPIINYKELQLATNNWDPQMILGKGGFGTVFRGLWKYTEVAIKRIEGKEDDPDSYMEQIKQSMTELNCLNVYRHDNILSLFGYSMGGPQPCLVYQFMRGGSLEGRLKDTKRRLKWPTRINITTGTARGLQFLHTIGEKPLVHGDIKPANILLDMNDIPRIGDFGLARQGPIEEYMRISKVHGTRPYLPHEFLRGKKFSTKVDTFSFGIVLFEVATRQPAFSSARPVKFLKDHVVDYEGDVLDLKDPSEEGGEDCFKRLIDLGKECVSHWAKDRPEMVQVFKELQQVKNKMPECWFEC